MSDLEKQMAETKEAGQQVKELPTIEQPQIRIGVTEDVAFQLRIQQFDKDIATAEFKVAELKKQKTEFIFNRNLEVITKQHNEEMIKKQIEEETKKKLMEKR